VARGRRRAPTRLGIDLGTTRTIVAAADRGNFPVVGFVAPDGDAVEHVPTTTAAVDGSLLHGLEAELAARAGAPHLRSWKRLLGRGPDAKIAIGTLEVTMLELASDFLRALRVRLRESSNVPGDLGDEPEVVVSV
jgi:molecular chaperone DnaK (HSP70)